MVFEESEIVISLRFLPTVEIWIFDIEYKEKKVLGKKLSLGVFHMLSNNLPFDFIVTDQSNNGIDPFRIDDFEEGRCVLYMLENIEMGVIRGQAVQV